MAKLPDPTRDLRWSDYPGAIHEIFACNAEKYPDRLCVFETGPGLSYTYRHINEASNILAHHLVKAGICREDVVMVYSHRGVDLVVAIMGVLKSGATFSVLDPAYPPDRQIIYLDVSRPKALIIIEKASQEAGKLADKVRAYIAENLELKTEVPALEILADGFLKGGIASGKDVLSSHQGSRAKAPGVIVGPDSVPTLSFTSGSEGRPKGVRGRHFSLAYYFPWMSKKFHLTENDRFTMLSGIAHDPIQRDIFTPLFLGAQIIVPSKEDIQHERLAEWMKTHKATVTHLTPAMGQILVGEASAEFPSLHHAFFVGDILIKRDCRALQRLAPNVNIVNMYGTTETQRAVSYYKIPSWNQDPTYLDGLKEVIPAGQGMLNVQLLVVDRTDRSRICGVGEIGEIYVRAGGLAEGYLGLPELTDQKFVQNWFLDPKKWVEEDEAKVASSEKQEPWRHFYKGPRDRLYRSGDLGQYTLTGDVECSGRADDQVKIRGFRIELGEINSHLTEHPLIRENVTLVRRDKFEEPTLVSYFVPEINKWSQWLKERGLKDDQSEEGMVGNLRRFHALRNDAREYLRGKLPDYAVPTVFIPLKRFPLNPNGKIDKPALPFPDTAELEASLVRRPSASLAGRSETEQRLAQIWAKLIPSVISARTIAADDSFFNLGGHSILAHRMRFDVRREWRGVEIATTAIYNCPTLRAFAAEIDRARDPEGFGGSDSIAGEDYAANATSLTSKLPKGFPSARANAKSHGRLAPPTVFLTGVTGFLGAFILRDLLTRTSPTVKVIALVRAKDQSAALTRIQKTCEAYGVWLPSWSEHIECFPGDLGSPFFGLTKDEWSYVNERANMIIHNGAQVHWVYPYSHLKAANVEGTLTAMQLAHNPPKRFVFVSSTSVLDTEHYVRLSERLIAAGGHGINEDDDLQGSSKGLANGYGQSKWVAEYLVREAGRRGLEGAIVRPGYVTGDSKHGVTNTDDFLVRMIKGCIQISSRPSIQNTVNMVPVDHVARIVVAAASPFNEGALCVCQVTSHPRLQMDQFLAVVEAYGFDLPEVDYETWRMRLERYVRSSEDTGSEVHALMPLYHFVTGDLPSGTKAPELDDTNTKAALKYDARWTGEDISTGIAMTPSLIKLYLEYLLEVDYLSYPRTNGEANGNAVAAERATAKREALKSIGGRGALA